MIVSKTFDDTIFKYIYYLGTYESNCDYDIRISQNKRILTSINYTNKTFCNYPLHSNKLSSGAIAGIINSYIVVLVVFIVMRARKNKDNSEE